LKGWAGYYAIDGESGQGIVNNLPCGHKPTYKNPNTNLSVASAKLTNSPTRESIRATVIYKDLDGHVLPLGRLAHIQVAGCERTIGNKIECVCVNRKTETSPRPQPERSGWKLWVCPIRYSSPGGATINVAVFDCWDAYVALHDVMRFQTSQKVTCTEGHHTLTGLMIPNISREVDTKVPVRSQINIATRKALMKRLPADT